MKNLMIATLLLLSVTGCRQYGMEATKPERSVAVETARVQAVSDSHRMTYSGTVEAAQVIPLSFRAEGIVEKVYADVGDAVSMGQVLATLDDAELRNMHDMAMARYVQAEDARNRLKQVYEQGSLPEVRWVEMLANYEQAKASLELARNNLEKCTLVAPAGGIVGRRNIEPGQSSILPAAAAFELVRIETVLVAIAVPENEINRLRVGQGAQIAVSALGGAEYAGETANISPVAEPLSRTYTVKIRVANPGRKLKPGMVCDVAVNCEAEGTILLVPLGAVCADGDGNTYVWLISPDSNRVKRQFVTTGSYRGSGIEITGGLMEGDVVVSSGMEKLSENSKLPM